MKRSLRLVSIVALWIGLFVGVPAGNGRALTRTTGNPTDTTALKTCVAENRKLDILFLMDVSASLYRLDNKPGSDPNGLRAETVRAVTELLATTTGINSTETGVERSQATEVNLAFLDFGKTVRNSFNQFSGWQPLSAIRAADDANKIFNQFKYKHGDADTDYVGALDPSDRITKDSPKDQVGAIDLLKQSVSPCRVLLWFTDGKLDFDRRPHSIPWVKGEVSGFAGVNEVKKLGKDVLCTSDPRHDGRALVDVLRASSTSSTPLFVGAIGLGKSQDFDLLKGIAEGRNSCGKLPASGRFVNASHPQDLLDAIQEVLLSPPPPPQITPCGKIPIGQQIFQIGSSLQKLSLVVTTRADGATISMVGPHGLRLPVVSNGLVSSSSIVDGISIDRGQRLFSVGSAGARVDYFLVTATLSADRGDWAGNWGLEFCHPGGNISPDDFFRVFVYGELTVVQGQRELTANRTKSIDLTIVGVGSLSNQSGVMGIDLGKYVTKINGQQVSGSSFDSATGQLRIPFSPGKADVGATVNVEVSSEPTFILNPNDKSATPIPINFQLWTGQFSVRDVPKTPGLIAGDGFTRIDKKHLSSTASFLVKAGDEDGQICLDIPNEARLKAEDSSAKTVSARITSTYKDCLEVAAGASPKKVTVSVNATKALLHLESDNFVSFKISWDARTSSGESDQAELLQDIPVVSAGTTTVNWARLVMGLILAILVPLGILYGYNYLLLARIMVPEMAFVATVRYRNGKFVEINPNGTEQQIAYNPENKKALSAGPSRNLVIGEMSIGGRMATNPFGETFAVASISDGIVLGSRGRIGHARDVRVRGLPDLGKSDIGLSSSWFISFVLDQLQKDEKTVACSLIVFGNSHEELKQNLASAAQDVADVFGIVVEEVQTSIDQWTLEQSLKKQSEVSDDPVSRMGAPTVDSNSSQKVNIAVPVLGSDDDRPGQFGNKPPMAT